MRLALLAARNSIHTVRWVNGLAARGHDVHLVTIHRGGDPISPAVTVHELPLQPPAGYFVDGLHLRRVLASVRPDLLHTHYASGYGTLAGTVGFHPHIISVWGADVYDFPRSSPLHRALVRRNLRAADRVCSTSHVMADRTQMLSPRITDIAVVPFGIDPDQFVPLPEPPGEREFITIGTVKILAHKYGIDTLIRSFAMLRRDMMVRDPARADRLRLVIVGQGPDAVSLKELAAGLGVADVTTFTGVVPHAAVPGILRSFDVYVATSRLDSESFGVAILEASACGVPVVVSDAGGLPEVVRDGETGVIVPRDDVAATAAALGAFAMDPARRQAFGAAGRQHVLAHYRWDECVAAMERVYAEVLASSGRFAVPA